MPAVQHAPRRSCTTRCRRRPRMSTPAHRRRACSGFTSKCWNLSRASAALRRRLARRIGDRDAARRAIATRASAGRRHLDAFASENCADVLAHGSRRPTVFASRFASSAGEAPARRPSRPPLRPPALAHAQAPIEPAHRPPARRSALGAHLRLKPWSSTVAGPTATPRCPRPRSSCRTRRRSVHGLRVRRSTGGARRHLRSKSVARSM